MKKLFCKIFGHHWTSAFNGEAACVRCGRRIPPPPYTGVGMPAAYHLAVHDPEWHAEFGAAPFHVALRAFVQRNPSFSEDLTRWVTNDPR